MDDKLHLVTKQIIGGLEERMLRAFYFSMIWEITPEAFEAVAQSVENAYIGEFSIYRINDNTTTVQADGASDL